MHQNCLRVNTLYYATRVLILLALLFTTPLLEGCSSEGNRNTEDVIVDDTEIETPAADTDIDVDSDGDIDSGTNSDSDTGSADDSDTGDDAGAEQAPEPNICDGSGPGPGQYQRTLNYGGRSRTYQLHVPPGYDKTTAAPLVFDLHAVSTNATIENLMTGLRGKSDKEGFVLVQPNGVGGSWNAGPLCCAPNDNIDDVGFIRAVRDKVVDDLCIDPKRVYSTGISNGGYLSHRIACDDTDLLAAIGPVVSNIGWTNLDLCQPSRPIPVAMITGGNDSLQDRIKTFEKWVALNGCSDSVVTEEIGVYTCTTHNECEDGVQTTHCIGQGVGHCWPGTTFQLYPCNQSFNAGDYLWDFFKKYRIP